MVWKKILVEELQNGCLVLVNLSYAWHLSSSLCSREYMVWKMMFEEFQDGCSMMDPL